MDPRDRLVDYALERLAREDESVDLSGRVRSAWERGVAGPDLHDLDASEVPRGPRALTREPRVRSRRAYAWAAAAVVLVGVGLWRWNLPAPQGDQVPVAEVNLSRPLPVLEGGVWRIGEEGLVARPIGAPLWVDGLAPAVVKLPGGASLAVQPGSRFAATENGVRLDWGGLEATSGEAALELELGDARVRLAPHSVLACDLDADHRAPSPDQLHLIEPAHFALAQGVARLRLQLHRGDAQLGSEGASIALSSGAAVDFALDASGPHPLDPGLRGGIQGMLAALFEGKPYPGPWTPYQDEAFAILLEQLGDEPAAWVDLEADFAAKLAEPMGAAQRGRFLDVLVTNRTRGARRLVEEQWRLHEPAFSADHLVAMAERGHPQFVEELEGIVALTEPGEQPPPGLADWIDPTLPAAYLALRGDARGVEHLRAQHLEAQHLQNQQWGGVIAALALHVAGVDRRPWRQCTEMIDMLAREQLALGNVGEAALLALAWEGYALMLAESRAPETFALAFLEGRLTRHVMLRQPAGMDANEVAALLDDLAGR